MKPVIVRFLDSTRERMDEREREIETLRQETATQRFNKGDSASARGYALTRDRLLTRNEESANGTSVPPKELGLVHEFDEILPSTNPSWKQEMVFGSWSQFLSVRNQSTTKPQIGWIISCFDWSPEHPWRKREDDLDGDMYHCIWDSNLTDHVQKNAENKGAHCALTKFGKTLSNQPQHPHHLPKHIRSRKVSVLTTSQPT